MGKPRKPDVSIIGCAGLALQILPFERSGCLGASAAAHDVAEYAIHDVSHSGLNDLLGLRQVATIRVTNSLGLRQEYRVSINRVDFGNKVGLDLVTPIGESRISGCDF